MKRGVLLTTLPLIDHEPIRELLWEMAELSDNQTVRTTIHNQEPQVILPHTDDGYKLPTLEWVKPVPHEGGWRHGVRRYTMSNLVGESGFEPFGTYPILRCQVAGPGDSEDVYYLSKGHLRTLWRDTEEAIKRGATLPGMLIAHRKGDALDVIVAEHTREAVLRLQDTPDPWEAVKEALLERIPEAFREGFPDRLKLLPHLTNTTVVGEYMKAFAYATPEELAVRFIPPKIVEPRKTILTDLKDFIKSSGLYQARTKRIPLR